MKTGFSLHGMTRLILAIFLLTFFNSCKSTGVSFTTIEEFEHEMHTLTSESSPPGISVIVVKGNDIAYANGFGYADVPKELKTTPQTTYQWWSVTKLFTATAILQLQEKGLLDIDYPVSQYLPFFKVKYPKDAAQEITIRQLLTHSSGLGDIGMEIIGWIHYEGDEPYDQTELVKEQLPPHDKLKYVPGTKGQYSNLGYIVLAALIEKVSGKAYDEYISEHILDPLEMSSTGFSYEGSVVENAASGSHPHDLMSLIAFTRFDRDKAIREKQNGIFWFNHFYANQQGSTGLIGSCEDLAHFVQAMLNDGVRNDMRLLSHESVRFMQTPQIGIDKSPAPGLEDPWFGLAWFIHKENGITALNHAGAGAAFVAHMRLYPDKKLGIAIMANSTYLERDMGSSIISQLAQIDW